MIPKHQASEAIILKSDNALKQEIAREKLSSAPLFREEVEGLMQALQEERIPLGYKEMPINLTTLNGPYQRVREIQGKKLRGLTYHIQNKTQKVQALSGSEVVKELPFNGHKIVAILIPKKTLNPKERTDIHVVLRAN